LPKQVFPTFDIEKAAAGERTPAQTEQTEQVIKFVFS
jgi:hypothetical protein